MIVDTHAKRKAGRKGSRNARAMAYGHKDVIGRAGRIVHECNAEADTDAKQHADALEAIVPLALQKQSKQDKENVNIHKRTRKKSVSK